MSSRGPTASVEGTVPDQYERDRAVDVTRSFLVQAPAGSGKTDLLIRRYLALLRTVNDPEEVVAITFTRKAAAEMRDRVLRAIAADEDPERRALSGNPARLRIQTIDALAAALTRQMPVLSRFGAPPATIEDASECYVEAARATLGRVDDDDAVAGPLARLLAHLDNDIARVETLLAGMLRRRDHWMRHLAHIDRGALEAALGAERARVFARARNLYGRDVEDWAALADALLTQANGWRRRSPEARALEGNEALREALVAIRALPPAAYSDSQWEALDAIRQLLPQAIAELKVVFAVRGQVDFTEISQAALRALGEADAPTDLALALDYRIRHLLVDEFQDTSISQYELIERLTAGWQPGDGRTVFAVGDPMQSIYRFREAEVGKFLRTRESCRLGDVLLETLTLSANFRSQAGIVEWVNDSFAGLMPADEDASCGAVPYAPSRAVRAREPGDAVSVHPFFDGDTAGEAAHVAALIAGIRADDPGATSAILVRSRNHLAEIVPALRDAGLRFRAIETESLGHRPVVGDLHALARALSHPCDRVAWLAVLRAPWCGLTLDELEALARAADAGDEGAAAAPLWPAIAAAAARGADERLERVHAALAPFVGLPLRAALRDAVEHAWCTLGGPACVADPTDLEDAAVYLDALAEAEAAGAIPDLAVFEAQLERLWALPDVLADETDVQVMTIHKAKGLEFDHVVVPGLARRGARDDKRLFLWMETPDHLLVAPIEETGADDGALYAWVQELEGVRAAHEELRLLYVAATRARRRLHLSAVLKRDGAAAKPPARGTPLARLWPVVGGEFEAAATAGDRTVAVASALEPPASGAALRRLAPGWVTPAPPPALVWRAAGAVRDVEPIEFSWVGETARHVGTVVHRWLHRIGERGLADWPAKRVDALRPGFAAELAAHGVLDAELDDAVERVATALRATLTDARGRWLLEAHPVSRFEYRLSTAAGGTVQRYVIDRYFETAEGERWVVDYKTSHHGGADVEGFLARELERYSGQLAAYRAVVGEECRCALYFPLLGAWRELDPAAPTAGLSATRS